MVAVHFFSRTCKKMHLNCEQRKIECHVPVTKKFNGISSHGICAMLIITFNHLAIESWLKFIREINFFRITIVID